MTAAIEAGSPPALPLWRRAALAALRVTVEHGEASQQIMRAPCIVTCNHLSLLDGIIIALAAPRPLVFPVTTKFSRDHPVAPAVLRWFERRGLGTVVPMDGDYFYPLRSLYRALQAGHSVCIFPEGRIADSGPLPENPGFQWLHEKTGCAVVHARLTGADKSRYFAKRGTRHLPPIHLAL